jgi:hypothetical protein
MRAAMSVTISLGEVLGDVGALAVLAILNYACLLLREPIVKKMGRNGMDAFRQVPGIGISLGDIYQILAATTRPQTPPSMMPSGLRRQLTKSVGRI